VKKRAVAQNATKKICAVEKSHFSRQNADFCVNRSTAFSGYMGGLYECHLNLIDVHATSSKGSSVSVLRKGNRSEKFL